MTTIVDIKGLAKYLDVSESYLYQGKRWKQLPHVNFGGVRFNVNEVWEYLKNADKNGKDVSGESSSEGVPDKDKRRIQNQKRCKGLGAKNNRTPKKPTTGKSKLIVLPGS